MIYLKNKNYLPFICTVSFFASIPMILALTITRPIQWTGILFCMIILLILANMYPYGVNINDDSITIKWLFWQNTVTSANLQYVRKSETYRVVYKSVVLRTRYNFRFNLIFEQYKRQDILKNRLSQIISLSNARIRPTKSDVLDWLK